MSFLNKYLYKQAAGGGTLSNLPDCLPYGPGENQFKYNKYFPGFVPSQLLFVFFQDNVSYPDQNSVLQPITQIDNQTVFQVFDYTPMKGRCAYKFDDGKPHNILGVNWNGVSNHKLKSAGQDPSTGNPYFYIESYPVDPTTGKPTKYWGSMAINSNPSATDAPACDEAAFGKRKPKKVSSKKGTTSEIKYLRSL